MVWAVLGMRTIYPLSRHLTPRHFFAGREEASLSYVTRASSPWAVYSQPVDGTPSTSTERSDLCAARQEDRFARWLWLEYEPTTRSTESTGWKPVLRKTSESLELLKVSGP